MFKPLLAKIEALEEQLAGLQQASVDHLQSLDEVMEETPEPLTAPRVGEWLSCWLAPMLALLVAHGLIIIVYDLNTLFLRLVSLLIPLPFAYALSARARRPRWVLTLMALGLSIPAVLGMSAVTGMVDSVPVLPANAREWREFLEYAASISLSFTTGLIVGGISRDRRRRNLRRADGLAATLARIVTNGAEQTDRFQSAVKKFNDLGGALTAAATIAASVYTGLQGVIGK